MRFAIPVLLLVLAAGNAAAQSFSPDLNGSQGDVVVNGDAAHADSGVVLRPKSARPSITARLAASGGKFVIFNAASSELLRVSGDGNVGIGTDSPGALLHLARNAAGIGPELILENKAGTANDAAAITFTSANAPRMRIFSAIDSSARGTFELHSLYPPPAAGDGPRVLFRVSGVGDVQVNGGAVPLNIQGNSGGGALSVAAQFQDLAYFQSVPHGIRLLMPGNSDIRVSGLQIGDWSQPIISNIAGGDVVVHSRLNVRHRDLDGHADLSLTSGDYPGQAFSPMLKLARLDGAAPEPGRIATYAFWIDPADNTLKLLHKTTGEIDRSTITANDALLTIAPATATRAAELTFKGAIVGAVYQDLAEWVPATTDVPPGTVVVLNPDRNNEVMASEREYDIRVAGVVSAQPGLILGPSGEGKEMVATTGRVRVRVDATRPIRVGDLLVSSSKAGIAMRSEPIHLGGVPIHRPGTIIGKALEPLAGGEGEILVLLSLQ